MVSIHIRRLSRMRRRRRKIQKTCSFGFNPHPAVKPDETRSIHPFAAPGQSFNPHPAVKPDETWFRVGRDHAGDQVSIHIRRLSRMRRTKPRSWVVS